MAVFSENIPVAVPVGDQPFRKRKKSCRCCSLFLCRPGAAAAFQLPVQPAYQTTAGTQSVYLRIVYDDGHYQQNDIPIYIPVHVVFNIVFFVFWFFLFRKDILLASGHTAKLDYRLFCAAGLILLAVALSMEVLAPHILQVLDKAVVLVFSIWFDCVGILIFFLFLLLTKSNFDNMRQTIMIRADALKEAEVSKNMLSAQENVIVSFAEILESKSGETGNHVKRVSEYCRILACALGYIPRMSRISALLR